MLSYEELCLKTKDTNIEFIKSGKSNGFVYQLLDNTSIRTMWVNKEFLVFYEDTQVWCSIKEFEKLLVNLMRDYQREAILFSLNLRKTYQALDMGLGKTAIAINLAANIQYKKLARATLVVAPLRTIYSTWPEEIAKWRPSMNYSLLHGELKDANLRDKANFYLLNFDGLPWFYNALHRYYKIHGKVPFNSLIIDEGSMVKNPKTKRFDILKKLAPLAPEFITILGGTPAPNSLLELWPQYYLLDKGKRLGPTITGYKKKYFFQVDRMGFVWKIIPEFKETIYSCIKDITYRLDAKDHIKLPERVDNIIKVKLPDKVMTQYKELEEEFFTELTSKESIEALNAMSLSLKLRQFVQGSIYHPDDAELITDQRRVIRIHDEKLKALEELVESASGQGILCAIQFRFELNQIRKKFPNAPVIAGGTSAKDANNYINKWNAGEIPLLLCHPASLSHGVNLQAGSHIIVWYGLTWSLEQYLQFNARLARYGQLHTVIVHHLVASGTIDEDIFKALKNKFRGMKDLLDYLKEGRSGRQDKRDL